MLFYRLKGMQAHTFLKYSGFSRGVRSLVRESSTKFEKWSKPFRATIGYLRQTNCCIALDFLYAIIMTLNLSGKVFGIQSALYSFPSSSVNFSGPSNIKIILLPFSIVSVCFLFAISSHCRKFVLSQSSRISTRLSTL